MFLSIPERYSETTCVLEVYLEGSDLEFDTHLLIEGSVSDTQCRKLGVALAFVIPHVVSLGYPVLLFGGSVTSPRGFLSTMGYALWIVVKNSKIN